MNIGIVTTSFSQAVAGAKFNELSNVLRRNGHSVRIIGQDYPRFAWGSRTARIFASAAAWCQIRQADKLIDLYIVDDYHGLFFNKLTTKQFIVLLPATYATIIRKIKAISFPQRSRYLDFLQYYLYPFLADIQRRACCNAVRIITTCEEASESIQKDYRIEGGRVSIIPAAVDTVKFNPSCDGSRWREKLGITGRKVILSIGQPFFLKGVYHLARAFANILKAYNDAVLVVAGEKDGSCDRKIFKLVSQMGVSDKIIFSGSCPHEEIPDLCASSDIFAHVSLSEGTARVILEAMACGKAILASDTGGTPEIISNGNEGLLVRAMDVPQIEEKLGILLQDPGLRSRLGANARIRAEKLFSWDIIGKRILSLCDGLVKSE